MYIATCSKTTSLLGLKHVHTIVFLHTASLSWYRMIIESISKLSLLNNFHHSPQKAAYWNASHHASMLDMRYKFSAQISQETSGTRFRGGRRSRDAGSRATSGDGSGGLGADGTGEGCRGGVCLSGLLRLHHKTTKHCVQIHKKTACMTMTPSHKLVERVSKWSLGW